MALVAKYKGEAERLQFLKESAMNKAKLYEQTLEREKLRVTNLRQMNSSLEAELSRKRAQADSAVEKMEELEACWKGGATREKLEALTKEKADRESLYEGLAREAEKGQRQADIAAEQVAALASLKKGERLELETLRKNLGIMGSRSDDDAIIGKLTLELTNIKVAYQQLARKYELSRSNKRRVEVELQRLEQRLDAKDEKLRQTQQTARARILAAERALESLQDEASNGVYGSSGLLKQFEALSERVKFLSQSKDDSANALRIAERERYELEGNLKAKEMEMSELKKLNSELRAVLTAGDGTVSNGRGGSRPDSTATVNATLSSSNRDVARRLLKLSEELKQAKLSNLRQNRELKLLREEKKHLQRRVKQQDQTLRRAGRRPRRCSNRGTPERA